MVNIDQNSNMFFPDGSMLRKDGQFVPMNVVAQVGIPAADWLKRVKAHLLQNKERLAIASVKLRAEAGRVQFDIIFDTGRPKTEDAWGLLERTWSALQEQSGVDYYDYGQALQMIENFITIKQG